MKLTRAQRHKIYKAVKKEYIKRYNRGEGCGLCYCFDQVTPYNYPWSLAIAFEDSFPEFISQRPPSKSIFDYWFSTYEERINCINKCIRETSPKSNKNKK